MLTNNINELIDSVLIHGPDILSDCVSVDENLSRYIKRLQEERLNYPVPLKELDTSNWYIPQDYKEFDIENWLLGQCKDIVSYNRTEQELGLYRKHGMIPVLKAMKYIVDTLRKNKIVWGVGRGSSVASYILYLIGVHKIDSIKYNIPIEEFFKES